jgi:hypothetical protein
MKYLKYTFIILGLGLLASCEYIESPDSTANVSSGFITFPALTLEGESFILLNVGASYEDPGYTATLGVDDITDQVDVTGDAVDTGKPGYYVVRYSVSTTNELGNDQTVTVLREIIVQGGDVDDLDLSGQYQGAGFGSSIVTVAKIGRGLYTADKALASGNNIAVSFYHVGGDLLAIPDQPGPFGNMNTASPGTDASLTPTGFQWSIFIGCCGVFGPITFDRI